MNKPVGYQRLQSYLNNLASLDEREGQSLHEILFFHRKQCIWLGREVPSNCPSIFANLIGMVKQGRLHTAIDAELPWTSVSEATELLIQQRVDGKIILNIV